MKLIGRNAKKDASLSSKWKTYRGSGNQPRTLEIRTYYVFLLKIEIKILFLYYYLLQDDFEYIFKVIFSIFFACQLHAFDTFHLINGRIYNFRCTLYNFTIDAWHATGSKSYINFKISIFQVVIHHWNDAAISILPSVTSTFEEHV